MTVGLGECRTVTVGPGECCTDTAGLGECCKITVGQPLLDLESVVQSPLD